LRGIELEEKKSEKERIRKLKNKWLRMNRKKLWQRKSSKKTRMSKTGLSRYKTYILMNAKERFATDKKSSLQVS